MKKTALLVIGIGLVGMAPPAMKTDPSALSGETASGYPPCSRTVTDRCIQLYERGVATAANLALNRKLGARSTAMGGPYEAPSATPAWGFSERTTSWSAPARQTSYPPCSRTVTDRCIQLYERGVRGERG